MCLCLILFACRLTILNLLVPGSKEGKGLYTLGIADCAFANLDRFSPNAAEIHGRLKAAVAAKKASELPPGLKEQLELQVDRYKPNDGSPTCELCFVPGLFSFPSTFSVYLSWLASLTSISLHRRTGARKAVHLADVHSEQRHLAV